MFIVQFVIEKREVEIKIKKQKGEEENKEKSKKQQKKQETKNTSIKKARFVGIAYCYLSKHNSSSMWDEQETECTHETRIFLQLTR